MSSVEGVAQNIIEAAAAVPIDSLTVAAGHIAAAYRSLAGIESGHLADALQLADAAYSSAARAEQQCSIGQSAIRKYIQSIGMATPHTERGLAQNQDPAQAGQPPSGALRVDGVFTQIIAETVVTGGEISNRTINELLARVAQLSGHVIEALRDPSQSASVVEAVRRLQALQYEPYANDSTKKVVNQALAALLYRDNGAALRDTITKGQPGVADKALELLGTTYGVHSNHDPQTTSLLAQWFGALVDTHAQAPSTTPGRSAQQENLIDTYARLLANANPEELTRLIGDSNAARSRTSVNARTHRSMYHAAMRRLAYNQELRARLFKRAGLDFTTTTKDWATGNTDNVGSDQYFVDNTESVIQLEAHQPGTCQQLAARLGVYNFSRYPAKVLHAAREALDNPPRDYILFMSAKGDHNGAMDVSNPLGVLHDEIQAIDPSCKIIPVEINTLADAVKIRRGLRRRGWGQAAHLIANGHSSPDGMHLGTERFSAKTAGGGKGRWRDAKTLLRSVVAPGGTINIVGCSAGKDEASLAQHIADGSQRETTAPGRDITLKGLHAEADPATGEPRPVVTFGIKGSDEISPTLTFTPA